MELTVAALRIHACEKISSLLASTWWPKRGRPNMAFGGVLCRGAQVSSCRPSFSTVRARATGRCTCAACETTGRP
eukprot:633286-Pyramimonas_sp.AAC.1